MERPARKPVWLRIVIGFVWLVLFSVSLASGSLLGWVGRSKVLKPMVEQVIHNTKPEAVFKDNVLTLLVLGCDEDRGYAQGYGKKRKPGDVLRHASRSDMMLVAKVDFDHKRISGISIPRDTLWQVPGYREQKINGYHYIGVNEGGPERGKELAKEAAEGVTGIKIDRVVVLNFDAFEEMVDMLGGIELFVPRTMDYDDFAGNLHIHLKKGRQLLKGYDAMCFVRYRHGDSDFKRQDRQKDLMIAMKDRMAKQWMNGGQVVDKTIDLLGKAFTADEIAALALFGRKVGTDNIKMDMVPVSEIPGSTGLHVDDEKLAAVLKKLHLTNDRTSTPAG